MTKKKEFNPEIKAAPVAQPQGAWASPFSQKLEEIQEVEESQSIYSTISSRQYFNSSGNVVVAPGGAFPNIVEHHTTNGVSENAVPSFASAAAASSSSSQQQQPLGLAFESKRVLIVDAGALLHGQTRLEQLGSEFYTTPQVIQEIRDSKSRHILAALPVQLNVKEPHSDSFAKVIRFAKKTGDFGFLSTSDLGILALTYEMELAANGAKNIKPEPKALGISGNPKVPITPYYEVMAILHGRPLRREEEEELEEDEDQQAAEEEQWEENVITSLDSDEEKHQESKEQKKQDQDEEEEEQITKESSEEEEEDDGEGWISPENIKTIKAQKSVNVERWVKPAEEEEEKEAAEPAPAPAVVEATPAETSAPATESTAPEVTSAETTAPAAESNTSAPTQKPNVIQRVVPNQSDSKVGCVTGDFAMQNVLLHMGLNLVSIDGRVMRVLKRWVKRCEECATLVVDTKRIFCPSCGNGDTLRKVSCITDSNGNTYYCFNPKKKFSLRGTKFAIPKQQGGRNAKNPILREDQLAKYKHHVPSVASKTKSLLNRKRNVGEDNWTISYSFDNNFANSEKRQAYKKANSAFNGIGRRNPNEPKKRTGKKKN